MLLVVANLDGVVRVWDLNPRRLGRPSNRDSGREHCPIQMDGSSSSPDGQWRCAPTATGAVLLHGTKPAGLPLPHEAPITASRFSPDGRLLATLSGNRVRVWTATTGEPVSSPLPVFDSPQPVPLGRLAFSTDGGRLALSFVEARNNPTWEAAPLAAVVWSVPEGKRLFALLAKVESGPQVFLEPTANGRVCRALLSPDGQHLVAAIDSSGEVAVYEIDSGRRRHLTKCYRGFSDSVTIDDKSERLLVSAGDAFIRELDVRTGRVGSTIRTPVRNFSLDISPDGQRLLTTGRNHKLYIWDRRTGDFLSALSVQPETPSSWSPSWFSRDSRQVNYFVKGARFQQTLPQYPGSEKAIPRVIRLLVGRYLDDTGGIVELDQDEFIDNRSDYRNSWLAGQRLADQPDRQP